MTPLEKEAHEALYEVLEQFAAGKRPGSGTYIEVMAKVRDAFWRLNNAALGCSTGTHQCQCTCKPAIVGKAVEYLRQQMR